jgi:hypothetical protein
MKSLNREICHLFLLSERSPQWFQNIIAGRNRNL